MILSPVNLYGVDIKDFDKYINFTNNYLKEIQETKSEDVNTLTNEIYLSFYPIAKNIRFLSSYMFLNLLHKKRSILGNNARPGEDSHWEHYCKRGSWYPWLWTRELIEPTKSHEEMWNVFFNSFTRHARKNILENNIAQPDNLYMNLCLYLSSILYTFDLSDKYNYLMKEYKYIMNWPKNANILAVQIRRGETCTKDCSKTDRSTYSIDNYIKSINKLLEVNDYTHIYISTDSNEEIDIIKEKQPTWNLLYIPIDRTKFFRMEKTPIDLEEFCRIEPARIPFIVDSAIADLYFISQCKGYISTLSNSEFSKCGWYLQIATQKRICPYINMNNEEINLFDINNVLLL